ncbi:hypothetical protein M885DRAFT_517059 [Pelagophyceae sp. CCMP2097]|nr:hypothetical protein M885DRAFT_517059 [Pelagophyceae sp. CCMP2097]|mmetsp:Transcript_3681/g.11196  ORF Transcript_3681/g.11196 Transcript_3681/m.11196 type:complete len:278 (-) Transcript_3681:81-914(-)
MAAGVASRGALSPRPALVKQRSFYSKRSLVLSALLLLAPCGIMYRQCCVLRDAVAACLTFHAFLGVAMGYEFRCLLRALTPQSAAKNQNGLRAGVGMWLFGMVVYLLCRAGSKPNEYLGVDVPALRATLDDFGVRRPAPMILFAAYFSVCNAALEELFWRQCIPQRLRRDFGFDAAEAAPRGRLPKFSHADACCSVAYSAYHSVIISLLMPNWFNVGVAFPFLAAFGHTLACVRDDPKLGLRTAVALHVGLDLASTFWILDLRFGWLDALFAQGLAA